TIRSSHKRRMRAGALFLASLLVSCLTVAAQDGNTGRNTYVTRCAGCHGTDGNGGELGPNIAVRLPARTDQELADIVRDGFPAAGMPAFPALSSQSTEL